MSDRWARILGVVVVIALAWVGVYWYRSAQPPISFDGAGPSTAVAKAPPPQPQPQSRPVLVDLPKPQPKTAPVPLVPTKSPPKGQATQPRPDPAPRTTAPIVEPPRFSDYTVKSGDTLEQIATMELGSAKNADAIRRANPLKDMTRLKAGDVIRIPLDPTNIQGKPSPDAPPPAPPAGHQEETVEYTVRAGDTLSKIAKEQYGDVSYKDFIFKANRDRIRSEHSLREGQRLRLPPKPK